MKLNIAGLDFTFDKDEERWECQIKSVEVLGGISANLYVYEYEETDNRDDFSKAISSFLKLDKFALKDAEDKLLKYLNDTNDYYAKSGGPVLEIEKDKTVWDYVTFGDEIAVDRAEDGVTVSVECECEWDEEHGLNLVFADGKRIVEAGPF